MSHAAIQIIESLIPQNQLQARTEIKKVKSSFAYMAPELVSQRWDKLWAFMIQEIIPHDDEPWILPIKKYWTKVVPTRNNNKEQEP